MPGNYLLQGLWRGECLPKKSQEPKTSFFAAVPKRLRTTVASHTRCDERALQQGGSSARTCRRKLAGTESRRFSRLAFPQTCLFWKPLRCLFLSKCCMWRSCRKTGFDFFLTIVLTGSGRLPSGRSYPLATRRKGRSSTEIGLPPIALQFVTRLSLL